MTKRKKVILTVVIVIAVIAVIIGVILIVRSANRAKVEVYPVERIREYSWGDQLGSYGNIMAGNVQNVFLDSNLLVSKVHVSVGDEVRVGDTLLTYDLGILSIDVESKELAIRIVENKITKAQRELDEIKAIVPSSPPPPPSAPGEDVLKNTIVAGTSAHSGDGSAANPFYYNIEYGTLVDKAFLAQLIPPVTPPPATGETGGEATPQPPSTPKVTYIKFNVYYPNNVLMYTYTIDSSKLKPETVGNWDSAAGITVAGDGAIDYSGADQTYGVLGKVADTTDYIGGPHYSQEEINRMIAEKENELAGLQIDLRQAKLDYEEAKAKLKGGTITSEIDGMVASVEDPSNLEAGKPLIVVQSGHGYTVNGSISELNLDKIEIGQEVYVTSWNLGQALTGTIVDISNIPTNNYGSMGMENPNSSYYTFTALIETTEVLTVGDWVDITFSENATQGGTSDVLYLPLAFVREKDGQSYVMKVGEDGKLVMQYVKTGKSLWGYAIEIKAGVSLSDQIAFPYGKNVKEGAPTVEAEGYYY